MRSKLHTVLCWLLMTICAGPAIAQQPVDAVSKEDAVQSSLTRSQHTIEKKLRVSLSTGRLQGCADLRTLFFFAFTGRNEIRFFSSDYGIMYPIPVICLSDSCCFKKNDQDSLFRYELKVPVAQATKENMLQIMRNDLRDYFGLKAAFEKRKMPYWSLMLNDRFDSLKLKTSEKTRELIRNGARQIDALANGVIFRDQSIDFILSMIDGNNRINRFNHPLVNETGITYHVDLALEAFLTDKEGLISVLKDTGFDLVLKEKEMNVLVIRGQQSSR